jgi:hypothetical protein
MLDKLEYIKKWCLQDQSALSSRDVADAVVRMIDDIYLTRDAELHVQPNGADGGACRHENIDPQTGLCSCGESFRNRPRPTAPVG